MIVYLNPMACAGTAAKRWQALRPALEAGPLHAGYELISDAAELPCRLAERSETGGLVVAAGGDGTVNLVASALMGLPEPLRRAWALGAIGLGSSNDFHRPRADRRLRLPALRMDASRARPRAVGQVRFVDAQGASRRALFLLNASVGVVALGNHVFNVPGAAGRALKRHWTTGAICHAALRAVLGGRDVDARVAVDGVSWTARVTNAHVLLSPYVSGGLRYGLDIQAERAFAIALCEGLGRGARFATMLALARGRFGGRVGTRLLAGRSVEIDPVALTPLELDGEVCLARSMRFDHLPGALNVCT
jgi:diacylglycerol kinase family enzyme